MNAIKSTVIEQAVQLAVAIGNEVVEVSEGWTKVEQVVHMKRPLVASVREALMGESRLRHWTIDPTPHNAAEEGFTDDATKVAITFPQ
jgi:hypothetical protein